MPQKHTPFILVLANSDQMSPTASADAPTVIRWVTQRPLMVQLWSDGSHSIRWWSNCDQTGHTMSADAPTVIRWVTASTDAPTVIRWVTAFADGPTGQSNHPSFQRQFLPPLPAGWDALQSEMADGQSRLTNRPAHQHSATLPGLHTAWPAVEFWRRKPWKMAEATSPNDFTARLDCPPITPV